MKTTTMLLISAAFAAVVAAPQATAQSCGAMRTGFEKWSQTQAIAPHRINLSVAPKRADALYVDYSDGVGNQASLKTVLTPFNAELSLPRSSSRYLIGRSAQAPGSIVPLPQFNWLCYVECLRRGGNVDDCSILCSGKPVQQ